jgi:hypothetical protein
MDAGAARNAKRKPETAQKPKNKRFQLRARILHAKNPQNLRTDEQILSQRKAGVSKWHQTSEIADFLMECTYFV